MLGEERPPRYRPALRFSAIRRAATLAAVNELFAGWQFALLRLVANWRLMLVAAIGVVVAATLLAVAPIYAQSMSDLGLRFRLERGLAEPEDRVAWIAVDRLRLGDPVDRERRTAIDNITKERVAWLGVGSDVIREERSDRLDLSFVGFEERAPPKPLAVTQRAAEPPRQNWGAFVFWLSDFERHVEIVEGRLPGPSTNGAEAVLPDGFQRHAKLGDVVRVAGPRYDDCQRVPGSDDPTVARDEVRCRPTTFVSTQATATIVGFVRPRDPDAPRWQLFEGDWVAPDEPFLPRLADAPSEESLALARGGRGSMPLLTTQEQILGAFATRLPELTTRHRAGIIPAIDEVALRDVPRAIDDLHAWRSDISDGLGLIAPSRFPVLDQLERFRNTQTFSQIPLLIILLQVVGIVIYYVAVVMSMLLDRQAEEVGVYRSRGASTAQIVGFTLIEGLVIAIPAAIVAPALATWLVRGLGYTPTFLSVTGGRALPVHVTPDAPLLAAAGAALALVAMLIPALVAARRGIIDVKREQSRPSARSLLQRYYLDFAFVGLAVLLLFQLNQRGTVFDPKSVGGWSTDPLLLAAPFVFTLAVGAMVLRFYPPVLRLGVRALLLFRGTAVAIGLRRAGRSPTAYARLLLLLLMAVAVGTFAASYGPTVDRSFDERIRYRAGAELRGALNDPKDFALAEKLAAVRARPEVADATVAYRGVIQTPTGLPLTVLAVDADRAASMLWFRDDFADETLTGLVRRLQSAVPPGGGVELPDDASAIEMRVFTEGEPGRGFIQVLLRDGHGHGHQAGFDAIERPGWTTMRVGVLETLPRPLTLVGIRVADRLGQNLRTDGILFFDDIIAIRPNGRRILIEDFEGPFRWMQLSQRDATEPISLAEGRGSGGSKALKWEYGRTISPRTRIFAMADPAVPLSALLNESALALLGTAPGLVADAVVEDLKVPVNVRAVTRFFPTLDPSQAFIVVNLAHLRSVSATLGFVDGEFANELWLTFKPGVSLEDQRALVTKLADPAGGAPLRLRGEVLHQQAQLEEVGADPTLQASGTGILAVAFAAVLGLSTLGFVVTLVLGARSRAIEFAVLRAVGSSRRQILRAMVLEWGVVLLIGGAIGVLLGRRVASVMLSFLEVTDQGTRVLPPFILETDWRTLALGAGALVVLVAVGLAFTWLEAMRRAGAATLRITQ